MIIFFYLFILFFNFRSTKVATKKQSRSLEPYWDETFSFDIDLNIHSACYFKLLDTDTFGNDFMGDFLIDLEPLALEEGTDFTKWFPLHQRKKRDKVLGDIQLTITLDHVKDEKSEKNHQLGFLHCSAPKLRNTANFSTDKNTM